jgi:hypothetical protein
MFLWPNDKTKIKEGTRPRRAAWKLNCPELSSMNGALKLCNSKISMIGSLMFYYINLALQIAKGNELPFGGVSVICFYDINQIRPVGGISLFSSCDTLQLDDFNRKGIELFRTFKLFHLKTQKRQTTDVYQEHQNPILLSMKMQAPKEPNRCHFCKSVILSSQNSERGQGSLPEPVGDVI